MKNFSALFWVVNTLAKLTKLHCWPSHFFNTSPFLVQILKKKKKKEQIEYTYCKVQVLNLWRLFWGDH